MNSIVENIFKDIFNDDPPFYIIANDITIRKVICDSEVIWGKQVVYYHLDEDNVVEKDCLLGESILSPDIDTTLSSYTFYGWRTDNTASSSILSEYILNEEDVHLYAVYKKTVNLSYNANGGSSTPSSQTGTVYYNNGNELAATFTLSSAISRQYYTFNNWRLNSASGTAYSAGSNISITTDSTMYASWTFTPVTYNSPALTLVSQSLSGSNATSNSCTINSNGIVFSMNAGYGNYTANAKTTNNLNLSGATKVVINFTCVEGSNDGNYDYMNFTFKLGSYSVTANSIDKTSGSATLNISGLTSAQLEIIALWKLNWNYATARGCSVYIKSIVVS